MNSLYSKFDTLFPNKCCQKYRVDSEFTIVTNFSNKMVYLNETAGYVFCMCNGKLSIQDIFDRIISEYDVSPDVLQSDLLTIIRDLQWNKIIKLSKVSK